MNDAQFDTFTTKMLEYGLDIDWSGNNNLNENHIDILKQHIDERDLYNREIQYTEIQYEMYPRQGSDEDKRRWKKKWKDLIIEHYKLKENKPTIRADNNSKRQKLWDQYNLSLIHI